MRTGALILLGLTYCATDVAAQDAKSSSLEIVDLRTPSQKKEHRDSIFSPVYVLADSNVKPAPKAQLRNQLLAHAEPNDIIRLTVEDLYIVDFFAQRSNSTHGNGSAGELIYKALAKASENKAFIESIAAPYDQDSVVCLVSGNLNGEPVQAYSFRVYRMQGVGILVHANMGFLDAVAGCIDDLSKQLLVSMHAVPAAQRTGSSFRRQDRLGASTDRALADIGD
jgi:hypothetical protein